MNSSAFAFATMKVAAPAKLNLSLDVTNRLENGYHELETVMQAVDICDEVTVSLSFFMENAMTTSFEPAKITCHCPRFPELDGEGNIAYKAARSFLDAADINKSCIGVEIIIRKQIPFGAGMGGGSADAAATLIALNHLCKTNLSLEALCEIGVTLGADVPFCIIGGTCLARGIGEKLTQIKSFPACFFVVAKPSAFISTKAAYAALDNSDGKIINHPNTTALLEAINNEQPVKASDFFLNVFEQVTDNKEIEGVKKALKQHGGLNPTMTGSGSAVFALFEEESAARDCYFSLCNLSSGSAGSVYICSPIDCGPQII